MAEKFVSKRNLDFLLYEVMESKRLTALPVFRANTTATPSTSTLSTAFKLAPATSLYPVFRDMDRGPPAYRERVQVTVHPSVQHFHARMRRRRMDRRPLFSRIMAGSRSPTWSA